MKCPQCGTEGAHTFETRQRRQYRYRQRRCLACKHRWATVEIPRDEYRALRDLTRGIRFLSAAMKTLEGDAEAKP